MKAGSFAASAPALLLARASVRRRAAAAAAAAARLPPAPAALSVPNPFAGLHPAGPRDLYQSPDGSDRFQHIAAQYPAPPADRRSRPIYVPGALLSVRLRYARTDPTRTSLAETYGMSMAETICGASANPRAAAGAGDDARLGAGVRRWVLRRTRRGVRACSGRPMNLDRRRAPRRVARAGLRNARVQRHDRTERHSCAIAATCSRSHDAALPSSRRRSRPR